MKPRSDQAGRRIAEIPGLVSVGVPVYNGAGLLRRALESLVAQTYLPLEIIVSDNASEDDSLAIAREFESKHPNVRVLSNEKNLGAAENFRIVLREARGEFFMWAAHDDQWAPTFASRLVAALRERPDAVLVQSGVRRVTDAGQDKGDVIFPDVYSMGRLRLAINTLLAPEGYAVFFYGVFRRAFLVESFKNYALFRGADRLYLAELALGSKLASVPEVLHIRGLRSDRRASARVVQATIPFMVEGGWNRLLVIRPACKMFFGSKVIPPVRKALAPIIIPAFLMALYRHEWKRFRHAVRQVLGKVLGDTTR